MVKFLKNHKMLAIFVLSVCVFLGWLLGGKETREFPSPDKKWSVQVVSPKAIRRHILYAHGSVYLYVMDIQRSERKFLTSHENGGMLNEGLTPITVLWDEDSDRFLYVMTNNFGFFLAFPYEYKNGFIESEEDRLPWMKTLLTRKVKQGALKEKEVANGLLRDYIVSF